LQTTHDILFKNASLMKNIPADSIDLMVTSPPYPMISMWDDLFTRQDPEIGKALKKNNGGKAFDLMHLLLDPVWEEIYRVMKSGGIACINIGDATRTLNDVFCLYQNHTRIVSSMLRIGFLSLPCILWRKQTNAPNKFMGSGMLPAGAYVTLEHEYILIFRKGGKRVFKTDHTRQKRRESAYFWEERNNWFSDVWTDLKGASQTLFTKAARDRSAAFPFELPYRLINMFSAKEDTVLDPFLGLGTTMFAAMASGRNSMGMEIYPDFEKDITANLPKIVTYSNNRIQQRIDGHLAFVEKRQQDQKQLKYQNIHYPFPVITRQEKDLFFNELLHTQKLEDHRFRVDYADGPGSILNGYWGELFRKQV
jgi:DNA modification methylase